MNSILCPHCGKEAFGRAAYCTSCGNALNVQETVKRERNPIAWKVDTPVELVVCILILIAANAFIIYIFSGLNDGSNISILSLMTWIAPLVIIDLVALWILRNWMTIKRNSHQSLWAIVLASVLYAWFPAVLFYELGVMGFYVGTVACPPKTSPGKMLESGLSGKGAF